MESWLIPSKTSLKELPSSGAIGLAGEVGQTGLWVDSGLGEDSGYTKLKVLIGLGTGVIEGDVEGVVEGAEDGAIGPRSDFGDSEPPKGFAIGLKGLVGESALVGETSVLVGEEGAPTVGAGRVIGTIGTAATG